MSMKQKGGKHLFILFFIVVCIGAVFYFYSFNDQRSMINDQLPEGIVVEDLGGGERVVRDVESGVEIKIPQYVSEQPSTTDLDFYSKERNCKFSVNAIDKSAATSLAALIDLDKEDLEFMTVAERSVEFLNDQKTKAFYTLDTHETGLSKVYYEDIGSKYLQVLIFSSDRIEECYKQIESLNK